MNSLRKTIKTLALLLAIALAACSSDKSQEPQSGGLKEKTSGESVAVEVNSRAPAIAARTLDGGEVSLADYVGTHVVLLEFWSIFCKSCIEEMPHVMELRERYREEGFEVLSINTDIFSDARILGALEKAGVEIDYPVLRDTRQEITKEYNVEILPVTVIIDRSGWIRLYQEGYRPGDEERFEELVVDLLRGGEDEEDVALAPSGGVTSFAAGDGLVTEGELGEPLPIKALEGEELVVGDGTGTAFFFWSLYCAPCREEFPLMQELGERYRARGMEIVSVNVDSERLDKRVRKFISKYPGLPCVPDWDLPGELSLSKLFGVGATPTLVVLDAAGAVTFSAEGHVKPDKLRGELEKALPKH